MTGGEFVGRADIEHKGGAGGIALPRRESRAVDMADAKAGGDGLSTLSRGGDGLGACGFEAGGRAVFEVEAGEAPCVPPSSEITRFGTPAVRNDCAPMMPRVRPAQDTTMVACGSGTRSATRKTSSAPGQVIAPGT